ncbi:hypothetical protein GCM10027612_48510 [Microbispora bryophytorum subsp. camponoti]
MRYLKRSGRLSVPRRTAQLATAAMLVATTMAACGGQDDGASAGAPKAPATIPELTKDPLTLSFIWFDWPPPTRWKPSRTRSTPKSGRM